MAQVAQVEPGPAAADSASLRRTRARGARPQHKNKTAAAFHGLQRFRFEVGSDAY